jgi:putative DNA primase/helicase
VTQTDIPDDLPEVNVEVGRDPRARGEKRQRVWIRLDGEEVYSAEILLQRDEDRRRFRNRACKKIDGLPAEQVLSDLEALASKDAAHTRTAAAAKAAGAMQSAVQADGTIPLGERDPESGRLVLSPKKTLPTAQAFVKEFYTHPEGATLHSYAGVLMGWRGNRYVEQEDEFLRQQILPWLHNALRYSYNPRTEQMKLVDFDANPASTNATLDSIRTFCHIPAVTVPPSWLAYFPDQPEPREILPCKSMLLHLPTMTTLTPNPQFFNINALNFDYDPNAPEPTEWLKFLDQVFPEDGDSVRLLQTWMGYCLTGDTSQQKMLLMLGPKRSGKGTIGRIMMHLVGATNVAGPTIGSLANTFGLQPLIGKSLAIVSDARFAGDNLGIVVERLLCISGEDALTIDRKYLGAVTMRLLVRFMFLTNELPKLAESSGALVGRFVILKFTQSFYGREDLDLERRLIAELPGILKWAIAGWHLLRQQGRFIEPPDVTETREEMEDLLSPVGAWVKEACEVNMWAREDTNDLYASWKTWCATNGRDRPGTIQTFSRDLHAAVPGLKNRQNRLSTRGSGRFLEGIRLVK